MCNYVEWAEELVRELLGWLGSVEELCTNECLLSDLEVRSREALFVCRSLVLLLGCRDLGLEFLVQCIQIDGELEGLCRGNFLFRMYRDC